MMQPHQAQPGTWPSGERQGGEQGSNVVAVWAFGLGCLAVLTLFVVGLIMGPGMLDALGPAPTREDVYRYYNEHLQAGTLPGWLIGGLLGLLVCLGFWVAGLVCAIVGVRQQRRRGFAMAAFALLGVFPILMCA